MAPKLDITTLNDGVDQLLEVTTNPRHRFLLQAFARHRLLEVAGRWPEIFDPSMTVDSPVYNFKYGGIDATLSGADAVKGLYSMWAETHQSVFYTEREQIAVADNYVASVAAVAYQQVYGKVLAANGVKVDDENAYYLYKSRGVQQIWPYDEQCRLVGEDVWEPLASQAELIKLAPSEVVTTEQAGKALSPLIKPLPKFDAATMSPARVG